MKLFYPRREGTNTLKHMEVFSYFSLVCGAIFLWFMRLRHIVTSSLVCLDINHFVHVARPCSSTRGSDGPV